MARTSEKALASATDLFGLLSDPIRMRLVLLLAKGERNVTSLCEELNLRQPSVSHHLGILRMTGLVTDRRHGRQIIYSLAANAKAAGGKLKLALPTCSVTVEGV